jgi:hypothetical protein
MADKSDFGFRISGFGFPSDFGASDFGLQGCPSPARVFFELVQSGASTDNLRELK